MNKIWMRLCLRAIRLALAISCFIGCPAIASETVKITIGYQALWAPAGEVYEALRHTNILELNGVQAQFKTFASGGPLGEAYVAGEIDNVVGADAPVLRALARRPGKVVQRVTDVRWGVVGRLDFAGTSLADLKGGKLAGPFGTTVVPRAIRLLIKAGLKDPFKELSIINQDIGEHIAALQAKQVDAVITWDPPLERLLSQRLGKPLYISSSQEGLGWQALSQDFIDKYGKDGVSRILKAYAMATWYASNHPDQTQAWFAKTSRFSLEILKAAHKTDRYLRSPVQSLAHMDFIVTPDDVRDAQGVMDFQVEQNLMSKKTDVAALVDMAFADAVLAEIKEGKYPPLEHIKIIK